MERRPVGWCTRWFLRPVPFEVTEIRLDSLEGPVYVRPVSSRPG
jgi:hypothetical protein